MRRRRILVRVLAVILVIAGGVYLFNAHWRVATPPGDTLLLAHRGVHQTFDLTGVENDTCTATRIREPIAPEIENTLASMGSAFQLGADIVELDVHPTTDGQFAVFHDWTLDCRTEGTGRTRDHDMAYLKTLDVGYGYTADGGATYPLRGTAVGAMPSLSEVMDGFPEGSFFINFKSNETREGDLLADLLAANPHWRDRIWGVYGGDAPVQRTTELVADLPGLSGASLRECLIPYMAAGWTGFMPDACRDTIVMVPVNYAGWLWGWPNLFLKRMQDAGSTIILRGAFAPGTPVGGIDSENDVAQVPDPFPAVVWTNEIAGIAPLLASR